MIKYNSRAKALSFFEIIMKKLLLRGYLHENIKGEIANFIMVMSEFDESVGVRSNFEFLDNNSIIYTQYNNPFSVLTGLLSCEELAKIFFHTYLNHIVGDCWRYQIINHFYLGDPETKILCEKVILPQNLCLSS